MIDLPRIGIPAPTSNDRAYNERCWPQYAAAIVQTGGDPVLIDIHQDPSLIARLAGSCQGILLPGSPADVHPQKYGEPVDPQTAAPDSLREATDELLLQDGFNLHKPLLGICYGLQSLNVWKGGSLVQHLTTAVDHSPASGTPIAHGLRIVSASSFVGRAFAGEPEQVNSSHHQAVKSVGDGLYIAAVCPTDGTIEALHATSGFTVGVQWHPERTFLSDAASRALFTLFVEAARRWSIPAVAAD